MTAEREIFRNARRFLNLLGISIFFALSLVFGSVYVRDSLKKGLTTDQGLMAARRETLALKQADLVSLRNHIGEYRTLKKHGLLGLAEREGWVEQLVASRESLAVGEALSYTLEPPRSLAEIGPGAAASPEGDQPKTDPGDPQYHDLIVDLANTHEGELIALLAHFQSHVKGRFRVQSCNLINPGAKGLQAVCTLRFFSLAESAKQ